MSKSKSKSVSSDPSSWTGMVVFAGIMTVLIGVFQVIAGFIGLFKNEVVYVGFENVWLVDWTTWGFVHLAFGLLLMLAGAAILSGKVWGRTVGVLLAGGSAIANFAFIPVYPFWSLMIIAVDFLIIYALIVHGKELSE